MAANPSGTLFVRLRQPPLKFLEDAVYKGPTRSSTAAPTESVASLRSPAQLKVGHGLRNFRDLPVRELWVCRSESTPEFSSERAPIVHWLVVRLLRHLYPPGEEVAAAHTASATLGPAAPRAR